MRSPRFRFPALFALLMVAALVLAACGGDDDNGNAGASEGDQTTLRLGYFPNVTHAPAIVGVENGLFEDSLGSGVDLKLSTYNSGTEAVEVVLTGDLDATFIGPNPAINAFAQTKGDIRIVSGTASGGAFLVVNNDIKGPDDLQDTKLATPQLGNTQDVALRAWLKDQGYETDTAGGGDVSVLPQENSQTLDAFINGDIDGAWVPEPWATRLVQEGDGHVLVDERDLWPDGEFVTTHLIVTKKFLDDHPDVIKKLLEGLDDAVTYINDNKADATTVVSEGIEKASGKPIAPDLVTESFKSITFTLDPIASSLKKSAEDAEAFDLLDPVDLSDIYDLTLVNEVLSDRNQPEVAST